MSIQEAQGGSSLQAAGMARSSIGAFYEAKVNKALLKTKAGIADINARVTDLAADSALAAGRTAKAKSDLEYGAMKAKQKVGLAASGVDLGSVSSQAVFNTTDYFKEVDSNIITANAAQAAWGLRMDATTFRNEALAARSESKTISPWMSAASSLLGSATKSAASRERRRYAEQGGLAKETIPGLPWTTSGSPKPGGGYY